MIVELRQYTLHPSRRDDLIDLFDREFVESQEAVGSEVLGQFRDDDDPDRFVWLRRFTDMDTRRRALAAFYGGPVWAAHRDAANATMIDSDDVLLLSPMAAAADGDATRRNDGVMPTSRISIAVLSFDGSADDERRSAFRRALSAAESAGIESLGSYETESAENTFPALPVRAGEQVLVWIIRFDTASDLDRSATTLRALVEPLRARSVAWLRLQPTARSAIR